MGGTACCFSSLVKVVSPAELRASDFNDYYAVILKGRASTTKAGCRGCDFLDGTASFCRPQTTESEAEACKICHEREDGAHTGWAVLFSKELLCCSETAWKPEDFSFFGYSYKESLHVSCREKEKLAQCIRDIKDETEWGVDKYSCRLILRKIEQLLIYCKRFYDRQFQTRSETCRCLIGKIDSAIDRYISNTHNAEASCSAIECIAKSLQMSPAYLADYVLFCNGYTMNEYFHRRQIYMAQEMIANTSHTFADIAKVTGFSSSRQLSAIMQKIYGLTPKELRHIS